MKKILHKMYNNHYIVKIDSIVQKKSVSKELKNRPTDKRKDAKFFSYEYILKNIEIKSILPNY